MRRSIYTGALIIAGIAGLKAQEKPIAKVHYIFKHINDTTQRDKFIRDEVVTYLGQSGSYYTSYLSARLSEQVSKQMNDPGFDGNLILSSNTTTIKDNYILDHTAQKIQKTVKVAGDEFILPEDFPVQDWEIQDEVKEIGGYPCQKATTSFKGRNYAAWFTSDIPMRFGPWKLHGLPGLILAAQDDKNEVSFEYAGFDKMDESGKGVIAPSEKAIASTATEVEKLEKAFKENPNAYLQARNSKSGGGTRVVVGSASGGVSGMRVQGSSIGSGSGSGALDPSKIKSMTVKKDDDYKPSQVTNNPIELSR